MLSLSVLGFELQKHTRTITMFSSVTPPCLSTTLWVLALVFASTRAAFSVYLPNLLVRVALKLQRVTQTMLRSLPVFLDARISDSVTAVHDNGPTVMDDHELL